MKRSSIRLPIGEPIYREVLKHAFRTAWHDRQYWLLALLAGILVTGGSYDVMWRAITSITSQGSYLALPVGERVVSALSRLHLSEVNSIISIMGGLEILLLLVAVTLAFAGISCIGQGGLVYAIGARRRGHDVSLSEALGVGGRMLWPVAALDAVTFAVIWILRFLAALPLYLALERTTTATYLVYIVSFSVFLLLSLVASIVQIFALNGIILQGAPTAEAIRRGYEMVKRHWVVVVETAILQVAITIVVWFVCMISVLLLMLPVLLLAMIASALHSGVIVGIAFAVGALALVMGLIAAAAFTIQLQYATWTYLFRRLGEGGVMPKFHRVVRSLTGFFSAPTG
ncbi:MAG: hypothetical protein ABIO72_02870 [Patescibacteria group bacterium]